MNYQPHFPKGKVMNIHKAQKRLVKAEKHISKLYEGLECVFGKDAYGVDNGAYTDLCQDVLAIKEALEALHAKSSKLAATSTMPEIVAFGPGNKGDD